MASLGGGQRLTPTRGEQTPICRAAFQTARGGCLTCQLQAACFTRAKGSCALFLLLKI